MISFEYFALSAIVQIKHSIYNYPTESSAAAASMIFRISSFLKSFVIDFNRWNTLRRRSCSFFWWSGWMKWNWFLLSIVDIMIHHKNGCDAITEEICVLSPFHEYDDCVDSWRWILRFKTDFLYSIFYFCTRTVCQKRRLRNSFSFIIHYLSANKNHNNSLDLSEMNVVMFKNQNSVY